MTGFVWWFVLSRDCGLWWGEIDCYSVQEVVSVTECVCVCVLASTLPEIVAIVIT